MRRVVAEIFHALIVACLIALLVWIAGRALEPATPPVALASTPQTALCTPSYCDPPEPALSAPVSPEPGAEITPSVVERR